MFRLGACCRRWRFRRRCFCRRRRFRCCSRCRLRRRCRRRFRSELVFRLLQAGRHLRASVWRQPTRTEKLSIIARKCVGTECRHNMRPSVQLPSFSRVDTSLSLPWKFPIVSGVSFWWRFWPWPLTFWIENRHVGYFIYYYQMHQDLTRGHFL